MSVECIAEYISPGYKKTDVGVIPEDWNDPKLEDIVKQDSPICYGIVQVGSYTPNGIPVIAIKNLNSDYYTNIHLASVEVERPYQRSRIFSEDVLISVKGTTGRIGIVPFGFYGNISRDLARLRLREGIVPKFVFQMLQSNLMQRHLEVAVVGTTRMELSITILKKVRIPLPPTKAEQEAIAEALSDADAFIESLEQLIAKKRQIKQGAMQELLTGKKQLIGFCRSDNKLKQTSVGVIPEDWTPFELQYVCERIAVGLATSVTKHYRPSGVPIIRNLNIKDGFFDGRDMLYISTEFAKANMTKTARAYDVLTVHTGANLGDTCVLPASFDNCQTFTTLITTPKPEVLNPYFLCLHMSSSLGKKEMNRLQVGGGKGNLNTGDLKRYQLCVPSLPEQKAIATTLSDMDLEIAALEEKLAKARQIKQGMMQELLTGRIRLI